MKAVLSLFAIVLGLSSCSMLVGERGNGDIQSKEFEIGDYTAVHLSGSAKMIYEQKATEKPYLKVEIDENLLPYIEPIVENGTLSLGTTKNINPTRYIIYTNSTSLNKAQLSGSGSLGLASDIQSENMELSVSGSGRMIAGYIDCKQLKSSISGSGSLEVDSLKSTSFTASISGSGRVKAIGSITESDIKVSGSGEVDIRDLVSEKSKVSVSGSGNARVSASNSLEASVSGSGNVYYAGSPEHKEISTFGSGKVISE